MLNILCNRRCWLSCLAETLAGEPFSLSDAYINRNARRPSLTAIQPIVDDDGNLKGYLAADIQAVEKQHLQSPHKGL